MKVGVNTPSVAKISPGIPATRMPAKVAQLMPREPGVISAMATISVTSEDVIKPWFTISGIHCLSGACYDGIAAFARSRENRSFD